MENSVPLSGAGTTVSTTRTKSHATPFTRHFHPLPLAEVQYFPAWRAGIRSYRGQVALFSQLYTLIMLLGS